MVIECLKNNYLFVCGHARSSLLCRLSLVSVSGGLSVVVVHGLLTAVTSLIAEHGSRHAGSVSCGPWA